LTKRLESSAKKVKPFAAGGYCRAQPAVLHVSIVLEVRQFADGDGIGFGEGIAQFSEMGFQAVASQHERRRKACGLIHWQS
jgi:hypothetical protein